MQTSFVRRVARPHLIRAALAGIVAVAALTVAQTIGDPKGAGLIEKLSTSVESEQGSSQTGTEDSIENEEVVEDVTTADLIALAAAIIFVLAGVVTVRALTTGAGRAVEQQLGNARGAPLSLIISIAGYAILILATLDLLGVEIGALLLGGAITGVVVGIAAQQTLGNAFAGLVLLIVRPFVVGEHVVLKSGSLGGEYEGLVTDISLFYVDLETEKGPVKLPNAGVLAGAVGPGAKSARPADEGEEPAQHSAHE